MQDQLGILFVAKKLLHAFIKKYTQITSLRQNLIQLQINGELRNKSSSD